MKKIIILFSLLLTAGLSTVFANPDPTPDEQVLNLFKKEFATAQNVAWSRQDDYEKATFLLMGHRVIAYFNQTGQLEGCIRDVFFDQLPLTVMTAVDRRFADAEITNVREVTNNDGTNYRIFLETKNKKYRIKVSSGGSIDEVEKLTK